MKLETIIKYKDIGDIGFHGLTHLLNVKHGDVFTFEPPAKINIPIYLSVENNLFLKINTLTSGDLQCFCVFFEEFRTNQYAEYYYDDPDEHYWHTHAWRTHANNYEPFVYLTTNTDTINLAKKIYLLTNDNIIEKARKIIRLNNMKKILEK